MSLNVICWNDSIRQISFRFSVCVRFASVKKRFMFELRELRAREQAQLTNQCVISLLMGMKFFRVRVRHMSPHA